jgi:hypothetical protein
MNKFLLGIVAGIVLVMMTSQYSFALTTLGNAAKEDINDALAPYAPESIKSMTIQLADNSNHTIYTANGTVPQPPTCGPNEHLHDGKCVPNPPPDDNHTTPDDNHTTPSPSKNITTIDFAGDFSGTSVISAMKGDYNIALGDMGYQKTLDAFISAFSKLKNDMCVIGNHDALEDGNAAIYAQAKKFCGELWLRKVANNTTLLIGWNSNGNMDTQLGKAQSYVMNSTFMKGIKNVVIMSHKPSQTHPNSHHPPEADTKTFYKSLEAKIPAGIKVYEVVGHNHEFAHNKDNTSFLAGSGGQTSHRACGTDAEWTYCKTGNAYLQFKIDNNTGKITSNFYNTKGEVLK